MCTLKYKGSFESFANSERYKTLITGEVPNMEFESFANSERYKTRVFTDKKNVAFESFANSERYKTLFKYVAIPF